MSSVFVLQIPVDSKLLELFSTTLEEDCSSLEELSSEEDDGASLEELASDDEDSSFFSLEELLFSDDDEFSFFSLDELFSEDEDLSSFTLEELCEDVDSVFLLDELSFTEEDDVLVCFTLDELAFTELEESFLLLEDSTSCSREELDSTNSGWVDELLELSSPQDTNRQTALNGINNRFNMDIRSLLQVLIDQYILIFRLFTPTGPKMPSKGAKKRPLRPPKITQLYKLQLADLFF
ncbi:hypothetical protein [uncultured Fibrobacter sp.]|uniref:hypothetical protein n=1 Tax=uncultured Fibrobacter sp. TaxID=261512 RepID=UPI0025E90C74|nr:hypothetical protein [uncultured Fibrobacter sp.]